MKKLYPVSTPFKAEVGLAHYDVRDDGSICRTLAHPLGWRGLADYELRKDMKIYRTVNHPLGFSALPDYEIRNASFVYRLARHPDGPGDGGPDYEIR